MYIEPGPGSKPDLMLKVTFDLLRRDFSRNGRTVTTNRIESFQELEFQSTKVSYFLVTVGIYSSNNTIDVLMCK